MMNKSVNVNTFKLTMVPNPEFQIRSLKMWSYGDRSENFNTDM